MPREINWNTLATIVFVDNPLNTGWSYSNYPNLNVSSTVQAGEFILDFFREFYEIFPNMTQSPTYIFGESFGGHWVPYYSQTFIDNFPSVNYQGMGIGDGWIDPMVQIQTYNQQMFMVGIIGGAEFNQINQQ